MTLPFTLTNDSITVVFNGKPHVVRRGASQFLALREAVAKGRWDDVPDLLDLRKALNKWAAGKFTFADDQFSFNGELVPHEINRRMVELATANKSPEPLMKFYERLQYNPSKRSVDQLWSFLVHTGVPITEDGKFLAYKSVDGEYKDHHTGHFLNKPGVTQEMPRNKISDDPREACHEGFHVGALSYASTFGNGGSRIVICEVDPADVVSVPYDSNAEKMRVCKYKVVGNHNGTKLPSVVFAEDAQTPDDDDFDIDEDAPIIEGELIDEAPKKRGGSRWRRFHAMDMNGLIKESLEDLRRYANKGLKITGASKISGGKVALAKLILSVRSPR